jgi:drug/metabolite transporter (DMT)-like permease
VVSASLSYSTVIFASLFGMLLWNEHLALSAWLGIALIIASGIAVSLAARTGH